MNLNHIYATAINRIQEAVMITTTDLDYPGPKVVFINTAFTQMTGYTLKDLEGQTPRLLQGPKTDRRILNQLRHQLNQGKDFEGETYNYRKDGSEFVMHWEVTGLYDNNGKLINYLAIQRDVTDQRQTQVQLAQSEERFQQFVSSISDHIYVTEVTPDNQHINHYISPHAAAMTGYPLEEFTQNWQFWPTIAIHPEDRPIAQAQFNRLLAGTTSESEYRLLRQDGQVLWVRDSARVETNPKTGSRFIYGVVSDITERKTMQEQLLHSQKMDAVGRLAGGIAHDFNNIIMAIIGSCEFILEELPASQLVRNEVNQIKTASEKASQLTDQLLAFSRSKAITPQVVNLNTIIQAVDRLLQRLVGHNISLHLNLDNQLSNVRADISQMEQVILNLAVNARDAMPAGGQLTIQTQNLTLAEDAYYGNISLKAGQYVLLKVQDTGIGITKEAQKHIFEPFYTTKAHGTGLGLSTTYGIVQQSGGKIGLQSQVDKGTSILICLPSVAESASESDVKMPKRHASIGAETILLVEDEDAVRLILTRALQRLGYTLLTACNAEEALNLYQHHPNPSDIDVLITDIMMNGMSGTALAAQLRPQNPNLYVVYMSGYTDTEFNSDTMPLDDRAIFLEKPFTPQTLHQMLQDLLQKK